MFIHNDDIALLGWLKNQIENNKISAEVVNGLELILTKCKAELAKSSNTQPDKNDTDSEELYK